MGKKVLVADFKVNKPTDYHEMPKHVRLFGNSGNKVFLSAMDQYFFNAHERKEGVQDYLDFSKLPTEAFYSAIIEHANNHYDCVVFSPANLLGPQARQSLSAATQAFKKSKKPIYILGIGVQAKDYTKLNKLISCIRKPAYDFIKTVYDSGGEFALRGHFTKEFFDKLGFHSAVVTGCPAFYQEGRDLQLTNTKVNEEDFKPIINGIIRDFSRKNFQKIFTQYPNSAYIDQDQCSDFLFNKISNHAYKHPPFSSATQCNRLVIDLITQDRFKLFYDIPVWKRYLKEQNFNFSFGARIHGNIMPALMGIPSLVHTIDTRTQELAEFFDLPRIQHYPQKKSLYDIYCNADYTQFNKTFASKFDHFENFLKTHGLVEQISDKQAFDAYINQQEYSYPPNVNKEYFASILPQLKNKYPQNTFLIYFYKILCRCCFGQLRQSFKRKYKTLLREAI